MDIGTVTHILTKIGIPEIAYRKQQKDSKDEITVHVQIVRKSWNLQPKQLKRSSKFLEAVVEVYSESPTCDHIKEVPFLDSFRDEKWLRYGILCIKEDLVTENGKRGCGTNLLGRWYKSGVLICKLVRKRRSVSTNRSWGVVYILYCIYYRIYV